MCLKNFGLGGCSDIVFACLFGWVGQSYLLAWYFMLFMALIIFWMRWWCMCLGQYEREDDNNITISSCLRSVVLLLHVVTFVTQNFHFAFKTKVFYVTTFTFIMCKVSIHSILHPSMMNSRREEKRTDQEPLSKEKRAMQSRSHNETSNSLTPSHNARSV